MSSHKFRTGRLAKKTFNPQHLYHLIHEMTPAQSSFFRECCLQFLGRPPSEYWAKQKVWFDLPDVDKKTLIYMAEALNHAPHITSFKIARNPKAGAGMSGIAKNVVKYGAKAAEYGAKAAKIGLKVYGVLKKINTGITAAEDFGIIPKDSAVGKANALLSLVTGASAGGGFSNPRDQRVRRKTRSY